MIEFRTLPDANSDLAHSPLLRAALPKLRYAQEHGAIGLTKTMAFKRVFVHWAVEHFDWPGKSAEEMFRYSKVINEYEFPSLKVLHQLLITLRLGRHFKGEFRLTKRGAEHASAQAQLFAELIQFFVLQIDHSSYARFEDRPFGKWDMWMNVINVEAGRADHTGSPRAPQPDRLSSADLNDSSRRRNAVERKAVAAQRRHCPSGDRQSARRPVRGTGFVPWHGCLA
jgi:hypothetical protein